jgi:hypothetical protein
MKERFSHNFIWFEICALSNNEVGNRMQREILPSRIENIAAANKRSRLTLEACNNSGTFLMIRFLITKTFRIAVWAAFSVVFSSRAAIITNAWVPVFKGIDYTTGQADTNEVRQQKVFAFRVDLQEPTIHFFPRPPTARIRSKRLAKRPPRLSIRTKSRWE